MNTGMRAKDVKRSTRGASSSQTGLGAAIKVLSPRHLKMKSPSKTLRTSQIKVNQENKRNTNTARIEGKASLISLLDHPDYAQSRSSRKFFAQAQKKERDTSVMDNHQGRLARYVSPLVAPRMSLGHFLKNKHYSLQGAKSASKIDNGMTDSGSIASPLHNGTALSSKLQHPPRPSPGQKRKTARPSPEQPPLQPFLGKRKHKKTPSQLKMFSDR